MEIHTIVDHEKCTKLHVLIVEQKPRFLSNLMELDRSIARIVIENANQEGIKYQKIIQR